MKNTNIIKNIMNIPKFLVGKCILLYLAAIIYGARGIAQINRTLKKLKK
jgi:hypothetical protein